MRVFVTGGSGFIGSAVVRELTGAGHEVLALARTEAAAKSLQLPRVEVLRGSLADADVLAAGARACDGVAHLAYIHDFSNIDASARADMLAIETFGAALAHSGRPLVVTSGVAHLKAGRIGTEDDVPDQTGAATHRIPAEAATLALAHKGVRACLVRLPPSVHDEGDHGFVPAIIGVAREKGVSAYIADGGNRWPAVHRLDAAALFRLALEKGSAGARYHGIGDEGVPTREIAAVIGRRLGLRVISTPVAEAHHHFGWIGRFFGIDCPASSAQTQARLGWRPRRAGLLADLDDPRYFGG